MKKNIWQFIRTTDAFEPLKVSKSANRLCKSPAPMSRAYFTSISTCTHAIATAIKNTILKIKKHIPILTLSSFWRSAESRIDCASHPRPSRVRIFHKHKHTCTHAIVTTIKKHNNKWKNKHITVLTLSNFWKSAEMRIDCANHPRPSRVRIFQCCSDRGKPAHARTCKSGVYSKKKKFFNTRKGKNT